MRTTYVYQVHVYNRDIQENIPAFNDVWMEREDAEAQREDLHKTGSWTALETSIKRLRVLPSQGRRQ